MNVRPTNSGTIVQARAHVLIGSFEPICCAACTFLNTLKSTNGPFLLERLIVCSLLQFQLSIPPRLAPTDDCFVRRLAALAGAAAFGGNASWADRMSTALRASFTTAVRMID